MLPAALLLLLVAAAIPGAAHTDEPGHVHVSVTLGDDPETEAFEADDRMTYRLQGTLVAEADENGTVHVRAPMPQDARLNGFSPDDARGTTRIEEAAGLRRFVVFEWTRDAPPAGSPVPDVRLEASQRVATAETLAIVWLNLTYDHLSVRIDVPADAQLTPGAELRRETHAAAGRQSWTNDDYPTETLAVALEPAAAAGDPSFAAPPSPYTGFLIVIGIALLSGGTWILGKRHELRGQGASGTGQDS